jgi:hypothetical protein
MDIRHPVAVWGSQGKHSLDRISLDLFSWSKVSVKFGVW